MAASDFYSVIQGWAEAAVTPGTLPGGYAIEYHTGPADAIVITAMNAVVTMGAASEDTDDSKRKFAIKEINVAFPTASLDPSANGRFKFQDLIWNIVAIQRAGHVTRCVCRRRELLATGSGVAQRK